EEQVRLSQLHIVDPAQLARHVAGKGKDWRMVAGCFIKAGDKVCTTRTGRARAYAETTSQLGLPGGRECRSFLVPDADPLYRAAANRVAQRVEGVADQTEDLSNADLFQHADQNVCDHLSHLLAPSLLRPPPSLRREKLILPKIGACFSSGRRSVASETVFVIFRRPVAGKALGVGSQVTRALAVPQSGKTRTSPASLSE